MGCLIHYRGCCRRYTGRCSLHVGFAGAMRDPTTSAWNAQALHRMLHAPCELLKPLRGLLYAPCELLQPLHGMHNYYVECCILYADCTGAAHTAVSFMWATQPLCGPPQPLHGLLQSLCGLQQPLTLTPTGEELRRRTRTKNGKKDKDGEKD